MYWCWNKPELVGEVNFCAWCGSCVDFGSKYDFGLIVFGSVLWHVNKIIIIIIISITSYVEPTLVHICDKF